MELQDLLVHSIIDSANIRLGESKERMLKCIDLLTQEQLVFRPNQVSNSIANIIIHVAGNMTQYIISSLGNNPDSRDRDSEFIPRNQISAIELKEKIAATFDEAFKIIQACDASHLLTKRNVQGFNLDGIGIITHVVEHASYHVGQITYLTKILTNSETNYYGGYNLNIQNG
jgi:uncharacterized damage-inducible protein DinB